MPEHANFSVASHSCMGMLERFDPEKDIDSFEDDDLETIAYAMFNAAASMRMLYVVDKYITDEARTKGEELMKKYDAFYPILRYNPEKA